MLTQSKTQTRINKNKQNNTDEIKIEMSSKKQKEAYILLEDTIGKCNKKLLGIKYSSDDHCNALKGGIYIEDKNKQPEEKSYVALISLDNRDQTLVVRYDKLRPLTKEEYRLLLPVPSTNERYDIMMGSIYPHALMIKVNDLVTIELDCSGGNTEKEGKVRHIGQIPHKEGTYFGVVFEAAIGDSDGCVGDVVLFNAKKNHGIIVSVDKIKHIKKAKNIQQTLDDKTKTTIHIPKSGVKSLYEYKNHSVGSRVIYFNENGKANPGTICFLGSTRYDDTVYAGVELDNDKGLNRGNWKHGIKLFNCKNDKAVIVEPEALMKEENFNSNNQKNGDRKNTNPQKEDKTQPQKGKKQKQLEEFDKKQNANDIDVNPQRKQQQEQKVLQEQDALMKKVAERNETRRSPLMDKHNQKENIVGSYSNAVKNDEFRNNTSSRQPSENEQLENINNKKKVYDKEINTLYGEIGIPCQTSECHVYEAINDVRPPQNNPLEVRNRKSSFDNQYNNQQINVNANFNKEPQNEEYKPSIEFSRMNNSENTHHSNIPLKEFSGNQQKSYLNNLSSNGNDVFPKDCSDAVVNQRDQETFDDSTANKMDLSIGTMVEVLVSKRPYYGVVRWRGHHEGIPGEMVGLELEEHGTLCVTDGVFNKKRYFTCPDGKAFFTKAKKCKPDRRFGAVSPTAPQQEPHYQEIKEPVEDIQVLAGCYLPPDVLDQRFEGRKHGIQGHHNSCYMDATLFAMYSYAHVFDVALHRKKRKNDVDDYEAVQSILKESIVNPLRINGYVKQESVMQLRQYLNKHTNVGGFLSEEKDPEELVVLLFDKVLKLDPFITLLQTNGNINTSHLYQIFTPEEKRNPLPSIQFLLELSLLHSDLLLKETPSVMVLQMPRFGQTKMFKRVQINPSLDLTPVLDRVTHLCEVCGEPSMFFCKDCACSTFGPNKVMVYLCEQCEECVHKRHSREKHEPVSLNPSDPINDGFENERNTLELFAVVCINTSHYVSFVKCGEGEHENWVFFDSMADRHGGENGYNIPEVTRLDKLKDYLHGEALPIADLEKKNHSVQNADVNKKMDEMILRFYEDASLCFYRNKRFTMYK